MSVNYWNQKFANNNYEWGLEPSPTGELALAVAQEHGYVNVIDIGCGYGRDVLYLSHHGIKAVGMDNAQEGINMAVVLAKERGLTTEFILANVLDYPFESETYDMASMSYTRHLLRLEDRRGITGVVLNLLKTGGRVIDMVPSVSDENYGRGKKVEKGTYRLRGKELHFFTRNEIVDDYTLFKIDRLKEVEIEERHSDGRVHNHRTWILVACKT